MIWTWGAKSFVWASSGPWMPSPMDSETTLSHTTRVSELAVGHFGSTWTLSSQVASIAPLHKSI
jgi:hypothetical protein